MSKKQETRNSKQDELQRIQELTEALQRERADAENMRRRFDEQIGSLKSMVKAAVISDLLPALDNLQLALAHTPKQKNDERRMKNDEWENWVQGINGVKVLFDKTIADLGIERIRTVGEPFNPNLHEAISVEGNGDAEIISEELQAGYKLGDEIIRTAKVKVKRSK